MQRKTAKLHLTQGAIFGVILGAMLGLGNGTITWGVTGFVMGVVLYAFFDWVSMMWQK